MLLLLLSAVCLTGLAHAAPSHPAHPALPAFIKLCYRDKDDFSECLLDSVQDLFPRLSSGLTDLDIPAMDPLHVEESYYEYTTPMYSGKTSVKDALVHGLSKSKFSNFVASVNDPENIVFESDIHVDHTMVEGHFKYQGKFMNLPLNGKGPFNITGDDVNIHWKLIGSLYTDNGERYLKIKSFLITPKFGDMHIEAKNIIQGNPQLSDVLVNMFNQYWKYGVDIGLPYTQEGWDKVFRPVPNRVFAKVPFDILFPTSK